METISKFLAVVLLVGFIFIVPNFLHAENADAVSQQAVQAYTVDFVENIKKQGKITQSMYNEFENELGATGHTFKIDFTHVHSYVTPVYEGTEVIGTRTNEDHYYSNDIKAALFTKEVSELEAQAGQVSGEYHMKKGDYITVHVFNTDQTLSDFFRSMFYGASKKGGSIEVVYGGTITDENYAQP